MGHRYWRLTHLSAKLCYALHRTKQRQNIHSLRVDTDACITIVGVIEFYTMFHYPEPHTTCSSKAGLLYSWGFMLECRQVKLGFFMPKPPQSTEETLVPLTVSNKACYTVYDGTESSLCTALHIGRDLSAQTKLQSTGQALLCPNDRSIRASQRNTKT